MQTLDLRFSEALFRFVSEATQRFPKTQVEMSPPSHRTISHNPDLSHLDQAKTDPQHPEHPYQMRVRLSLWSFEDVNLKAWLLGLGLGVKVIGPDHLFDWVKQELLQAVALYD